MFKIPLKLCGITGKLLLKFNNDGNSASEVNRGDFS